MSKAAISKFAETILQHYPPFRWDEHQITGWAETLVRELSGFSDEVVERSTREILRTRKKPQTPLVSEMLDACHEAKKWIEAEQNKGKLPIERAPDPFVKDWREDEFANNIALNRNDPICVRAAKEGWIGTLHSFVRKHRRMPSEQQKVAYKKSIKAPEQFVSEVEWCKCEAKDFDEAYAKCVRGGWPYAKDLVSNVGDAMLKKRNELIDCVLHGVDWRK